MVIMLIGLPDEVRVSTAGAPVGRAGGATSCAGNQQVPGVPLRAGTGTPAGAKWSRPTGKNRRGGSGYVAPAKRVKMSACRSSSGSYVIVSSSSPSTMRPSTRSWVRQAGPEIRRQITILLSGDGQFRCPGPRGGPAAGPTGAGRAAAWLAGSCRVRLCQQLMTPRRALSNRQVPPDRPGGSRSPDAGGARAPVLRIRRGRPS